MCGIVGIIGQNQAAENVLEGLRRLEYRGYDSAGIACMSNGSVSVTKAKGKIQCLSDKIDSSPFQAHNMAMGHTRWATHGEPTESNAHPHQAGKCTVVHNGIIENYQEIRTELGEKGVTFASDTDTETIPALVNHLLEQGTDIKFAVQQAVPQLEGAFAVGLMVEGEDVLIGMRRGAPLVVGLGEQENYLGSDPAALANLTNKFMFLNDDDIAILSATGIEIFRPDGTPVTLDVKEVDVANITAGKGAFDHFMLKEIHEQPAVVSNLLQAYVNADNSLNLPEMPFSLADVPAINIVACGSAYLAGMVGKYTLEQITGTPVNVDVASEFRYRNPPFIQGGLFIAVSQSGETADTLAALDHAKANGQYVLSLTNATTSSIARASDVVMDIHAGPEIAVASTKAVMTMMVAFELLALKMAAEKGVNVSELQQHVQDLRELPAKLTQLINQSKDIKTLAEKLKNATSMLYLGRGVLQPLAYEGALKMKEITYIHAEAYASGEMKHGPIALVDENLPVVNLAASSDGLFDKTVSNMKEVEARRGQVVLITDTTGAQKLDAYIRAKADIITLPDMPALLLPMAFAIPLQLLSYYTALARGTDVDQPRNLAKSVTVE